MIEPTQTTRPRCGDDLAWCGWPNGMARTSDCDLVYRASEGEYRAMARQVANVDDSRGPRARRLYAEVIDHAAN